MSNISFLRTAALTNLGGAPDWMRGAEDLASTLSANAME
jgi:hypothetical protein